MDAWMVRSPTQWRHLETCLPTPGPYTTDTKRVLVRRRGGGHTRDAPLGPGVGRGRPRRQGGRIGGNTPGPVGKDTGVCQYHTMAMQASTSCRSLGVNQLDLPATRPQHPTSQGTSNDSKLGVAELNCLVKWSFSPRVAHVFRFTVRRGHHTNFDPAQRVALCACPPRYLVGWTASCACGQCRRRPRGPAASTTHPSITAVTSGYAPTPSTPYSATAPR